MASWVEMMEEEEERQERRGGMEKRNYDDDGDCTVEEMPSSPTCDGRHGAEEEMNDVLELTCGESDLCSESQTSDYDDDDVTGTNGGDSGGGGGGVVAEPDEQRPPAADGGGKETRHTKRAKSRRMSGKTVRSRRRHRRGADVRAVEHAITRHRLDEILPRHKWTVRWMRSGFEPLVYDICDCNESPNVIFTTLCYQAADVFTMVLRNCNCKRRYWYDTRSKSKRRHTTPQSVGDFERAMLWRSDAIGRSWSSPGYDLASFALQHVATDRRTIERRTVPPLVLVTTSEMLHEAAIGDQLVHPSSLYKKIHPCVVCREPSRTVTEDSASVPTFTCWQHSSSQLADSSAYRTRVCDTLVVDLQFSHDRRNDEYTCTLNAVLNDSPAVKSNERRRKATGTSTHSFPIAELVTVAADSRPGDLWSRAREREPTGTVIDSEDAHAACCRDSHNNGEDLFPSMPTNGVAGRSTGGSVQHYDTTIGRVSDMLYCTASKFQKL